MRVIDCATRIAPFGDLVGDLTAYGSRLSELRRRFADEARVEASRLTFADYAIATPRVLAAFRQAAGDGPAALAMRADAPSRVLTPVSSVRHRDGLMLFDIFLDAPPDADLDTLRDIAAPAVVDLDWRTRRREVHRVGPLPHHIDLPVDGNIAAHIEHWVHALWAFPALLPAVLGRRRNHIGKNVKIHPTADVEGSIIGDNARIGAKCAIRNSYIGPQSHLSDFTKVTWSMLDEQTHTLADASFSNVVSMGLGTLANLLLRDVILGRQVFLTTGVIFWNESIDSTVAVEHGGELIDTARKTLGGCAGHGCILGARTIIAPGRALPNRTTVVMRREESVLRIEDVATATPMCWYDAGLVPAERLLGEGQAPDEMDGDRRRAPPLPLADEPRIEQGDG